MSRILFAAGILRPPHPPFSRMVHTETVSRSYTCPIPECEEPDGVTVELHWDPGIGELGILAGWVAGNAVPHCGCTLTARETEDLRSLAEDEANGHGD